MRTTKPISMQQRRRFRQAPSADDTHRAPPPKPTADAPTPATPPVATRKLLLTPLEAAQALSINRSTLYGLLMRGEIDSLLIGRARRIPVQALEEWIERERARQRIA